MLLNRWSLFIAVVTAIAFGEQEKKVESNFYTHNIGAGAGVSTGLGLSYRHWFPNTWGVQVNLIPIVNNTSGSRDIFTSFGLTGLKILKQARMVSLFGYTGGHWMYQKNTYPDNGVGGSVDTKISTVYLGFGPGIDIHFWKLSFNIMAGIAGRYVDSTNWGIQMSGETALYYTF